ncbi:TetR family transcriptional regulator [Mycobacterium sp. E1747]|uniref:TetR family transcriptional regulator n=1 Tax=Mycobacterium sp. E1747 TaxID=1834128 RepID=UPI0007FD4E09|nr:TetR family transcriptional regulator [Mycobacterium sp. E1747]OBH11056.1 hypothetical protein A5695_20705 [Mycobacterium sp. E1747]
MLDRLVHAADAALANVEVEALTVDAVAAAAGVSRATAFRHMGTQADMIVAVGMLRAARYARTCAAEMDRHPTVLGKIEAAFLHLARELPADSVMRAMFVVQTASDIGDEASELTMATLGPVIDQGRSSGVIRADVSTERVVSWIVEQLYLAMQQPDPTDDHAARERVRLFLIPALLPQRVDATPSLDCRSQLDEISAALNRATEAASALRDRMTAPP